MGEHDVPVGCRTAWYRAAVRMIERPLSSNRIIAAALLAFGLLLGAQQVCPSPASAQATSASERALARQAFRQGMEAARAERWEDARLAFARAWELVQRPSVLLNLATAQVHTGHLVEGAENYRRYVREAGDDADPQVVRGARRRLRQVEARTPRLTLLVTELRDGDQLMLDGAPVSRGVLSAPLPVNPGAHALRVMRDGEVVAQAEISLDEGAEHSLRLEVPAPARQITEVPAPDRAARDATDTPARPGPLTPPPDPPDQDEGGGALSSPWLWIAVGLVVAGGVTAGVVLTRDAGQSPFTGNVTPGFLEVE